jgi:UDP:flavonoid glycosyltransferase YjiC (YdhE family)
MKKSKINLAAVVVPEMGHLIPMLNVIEELILKGHSVTMILPEYTSERCLSMVHQTGCKTVITKDGITRDQMIPGDGRENPTAFCGYKRWIPLLKEEMMTLRPDMALVDFITVPGFIVSDDLGIQVVANMPGPANLLNLMGVQMPIKKNTSNCCGFVCLRQ